MTTEFNQLQIENPPKQKKNDGGELVHGEGLAKVTGPKEVKSAGHAAAGAVVVEDEGENAGKGDGPNVQAGEMSKRVQGRQGGEPEAHEFFAGHDCAAQGQTALLKMRIQ